MAEDEKLNSALNLMRRMPPSSVENSLAGLIELVPELTDELLNHVDQPLKSQNDPATGKMFIMCDYNRDGDSYRSPWSNKYYPEMEDGFVPSDRLRALEVEANHIFDIYRKLYFEGGISSVYFFDTDEKDEKSFGATFLIHKDVQPGQKGGKNLKKGWWDSIHVFEVVEEKKNVFVYKLTTTVMVSMNLGDEKIGTVDLSGNMTKQDTKRCPLDVENTHISNLGKMLEDMELRIRNAIEGIYIQKTREIINGMRNMHSTRDKAWESITKSLNAAVLTHGKRATESAADHASTSTDS
jgi:capping protein beta